MNRRENIKRFGLLRVTLAALADRYRKFIKVWVVLGRKLEPTFELPSEHQKFELKQLTREEALIAAENAVLELTQDFIESAFNRENYCFGAFDQGNLIAYHWRSTNIAPLTQDLQIRFDARPQCYSYKSFVLPEYRGLRLIQSLERADDVHLIERGIERAFGYIALDNLPSLTAFLRNPKHYQIGHAGVVTISKYRWTFQTGGARKTFAFEHL